MNTSVVVVHGIGDPLPGNALESLIEGLTAAQWVLVEPIRIEHRRDELGVQQTDAPEPRFPVATAALLSADGHERLSLHEVYWGDLSRPRASVFGLVSALFDLIFGLRYLVTAASNQLTGYAHWGAQLARAALWWARGPMFALNILTATVCLTYVALLSVASPLGETSPIAAPLSAVWLGSALVLTAGWAVRQFAERLQWSPSTGNWMMLLAPFAALLGLWKREDLHDNLRAFIGDAVGSDLSEGRMIGITDVMVLFASVMALVALASLAISATRAVFGEKRDRGPLTVVTFCTSLGLSLFTFIVVAVWVVIGKSIREDPADRLQRCLKVSDDVLRDCLNYKWDPTAGTVLADRVEAGIHLLPWVVFGFAVMAACFLGVAFGNWVRARRHNDRRFRYIVSSSVVFFGTAINAIYGVFFLVLAASLMFHAPGLPERLGLAEYKPLALAFTAVIASLAVATRTHFLASLDLVLDVIAHFRTEGEDWLGRGGRHRAWERIVARFLCVLRTELDTSGAANLLVLAHSQGTTIAAHGLGALKVKGQPVGSVGAASRRVRFVTMGSPIDHLYRHYLPARYRLRPDAVVDWRNIYRVDDFVGTRIHDIGAGGGTNIGSGGHSDYWSDNRVLSLVFPAAGRAAPGSASGPMPS